MTKERAKARKRKRLEDKPASPKTPKWGLPVLIFGLMLVVMGVLRIAQKGSAFAWPDVAFVVLFAAFMAVLAYFRPKLFNS